MKPIVCMSTHSGVHSNIWLCAINYNNCTSHLAPRCPDIVPGEGIGTITYTSTTRAVGSQAVHTCISSDYVPNGDLVRMCLDTGELEAMWDLPEETCRR